MFLPLCSESRLTFVLLCDGVSGLRAGQVRVVGGARSDVWSAVVGALQTAVGRVQEVAVGGDVASRERLLPLEHFQPLLHLPLELLVLQLLLLVNALWWRPRQSGVDIPVLGSVTWLENFTFIYNLTYFCTALCPLQTCNWFGADLEANKSMASVISD